MSLEERFRFNALATLFPFLLFVGLATYALVRGPQRLLLPEVLVDTLYPYALLPWEWPFAAEFDLFQRQFVVLALIGVGVQIVAGLPAVIPRMPGIQAMPEKPKKILTLMGTAILFCIGRVAFLNEMAGNAYEGPLNFNRVVLIATAPILFCGISCMTIMLLIVLGFYVNPRNYAPQ